MSAPPAAVPAHIAIVMDGNGRWATRRFLPRLAGHRQGVESLRRCARACVDRGVAVLTVFAFSSENWNRPVDEVSGLLDLTGRALAREVPHLLKDGVRVHFVGNKGALSEKSTAGGARRRLDSGTLRRAQWPGLHRRRQHRLDDRHGMGHAAA